jgi:hypothetical protein
VVPSTADAGARYRGATEMATTKKGAKKTTTKRSTKAKKSTAKRSTKVRKTTKRGKK